MIFHYYEPGSILEIYNTLKVLQAYCFLYIFRINRLIFHFIKKLSVEAGVNAIQQR